MVPFTFRIQVSHQTQGPPSESLPAAPGIQQGASRRRSSAELSTLSRHDEGTGAPRLGAAGCPSRCVTRTSRAYARIAAVIRAVALSALSTGSAIVTPGDPEMVNSLVSAMSGRGWTAGLTSVV
jgi:hypothetical protein